MSPKKRKAEADAPKLSPWDVLALARAEHEVKEREQALKALRLEKQTLESQAQVLVLRLKMTQEECDRKLEEARKQLEGSKKSAKALSLQLAERHCFSWNTHSYNPDTGELVAQEP